MKAKRSSRPTRKTSAPLEAGRETLPKKNVSLKEIFDHINDIRKHVKPLPKGVTIKDLIEEGRT
jgi:hypothetical protein